MEDVALAGLNYRDINYIKNTVVSIIYVLIMQMDKIILVIKQVCH